MKWEEGGNHIQSEELRGYQLPVSPSYEGITSSVGSCLTVQ